MDSGLRPYSPPPRPRANLHLYLVKALDTPPTVDRTRSATVYCVFSKKKKLHIVGSQRELENNISLNGEFFWLINIGDDDETCTLRVTGNVNLTRFGVRATRG